ncbi:MAG: hypothetical protein MZU79_05125 [Anaerotruncus sp.]|nr:hypothetical protein [Anaerotruncus sp.]
MPQREDRLDEADAAAQLAVPGEGHERAARARGTVRSPSGPRSRCPDRGIP